MNLNFSRLQKHWVIPNFTWNTRTGKIGEKSTSYSLLVVSAVLYFQWDLSLSQFLNILYAQPHLKNPNDPQISSWNITNQKDLVISLVEKNIDSGGFTQVTLHKKWSFSLRISPVNVTKSTTRIILGYIISIISGNFNEKLKTKFEHLCFIVILGISVNVSADPTKNDGLTFFISGIRNTCQKSKWPINSFVTIIKKILNKIGQRLDYKLKNELQTETSSKIEWKWCRINAKKDAF